MVDVVWIIGGASVYAEALPMADRVYLTHIHQEFPCDVNFPRKLTELLMVGQGSKLATLISCRY